MHTKYNTTYKIYSSNRCIFSSIGSFYFIFQLTYIYICSEKKWDIFHRSHIIVYFFKFWAQIKSVIFRLDENRKSKIRAGKLDCRIIENVMKKNQNEQKIKKENTRRQKKTFHMMSCHDYLKIYFKQTRKHTTKLNNNRIE